MSKRVPFGKLLVLAIRIVDSPIDYDKPLTLNGEPVAAFMPSDIVTMNAAGWECAEISRLPYNLHARVVSALNEYTFEKAQE
jgi:hypothetical protein